MTLLTKNQPLYPIALIPLLPLAISAYASVEKQERLNKDICNVFLF